MPHPEITLPPVLACSNWNWILLPQSNCNFMAVHQDDCDIADFVYRISTAQEWDELQSTGATFGGHLDKSTACIHLSSLHQVPSTLQNFFLNVKADLYLLQIDAKKLRDGLIYEGVDDLNAFPHFYGPSRSFSPLPRDAVRKAEKLRFSDGKFTCDMLLK
ncbi:uncharacterized protein LOC127258715 [Andrographis paniculata]|uniref:uncharacterized protein LOC127258715 n=1 Tax=Andrographis paniculata TaxID=175694 RepID=UPI0021E77930|nr:uncharacterized protein LOC127258715 [Andrographis paniculata]